MVLLSCGIAFWSSRMAGTFSMTPDLYLLVMWIQFIITSWLSSVCWVWISSPAVSVVDCTGAGVPCVICEMQMIWGMNKMSQKTQNDWSKGSPRVSKRGGRRERRNKLTQGITKSVKDETRGCSWDPWVYDSVIKVIWNIEVPEHEIMGKPEKGRDQPAECARHTWLYYQMQRSAAEGGWNPECAEHTQVTMMRTSEVEGRGSGIQNTTFVGVIRLM